MSLGHSGGWLIYWVHYGFYNLYPRLSGSVDEINGYCYFEKKILIATAKKTDWAGATSKSPELRFIDEYLTGRGGRASRRHYMEEQVPETCPTAQMFRMLYAFPKPLCVPSVGRDTELQISPSNRCGEIQQLT